MTPTTASAIQRALDAALAFLLPTGEARELDDREIMPIERAQLFAGTAWQDTEIEA